MTMSLLAVLALGLLTEPDARRAVEAESIQGVWQAVEVTITGPGARTIAIPEPRPNLTMLYGQALQPNPCRRRTSASRAGGREQGERR